MNPLVGQGSRHKHVDPSQKMILRNAIIEAELVEQLALVPPLPTHHRPVLRRRSPQQTESPFAASLNALYRQHRPIADKSACGHTASF
jgi:hypothetical protein